jgi:hypothetical protein
VEANKDIRPEWLKSLAEKTWNMELIISGAATYLSSFLPEITDKAFYYFLDNIAQDQNLANLNLPILAYGFAKMIAYLLPLTFIIHFIMRAFWAGMVGVHTVYLQGILYDKLPGQKAVAKKLYEVHYGSLSDYIARLDKWCNQIFGFAFTIALMGIGLSAVYLAIFLASTFIIPIIFSDKAHVSPILSIIFAIIAVLMAVTQLLIGRLDQIKNPRLYKYAGWIIVYMPQIILPFIYTPFNYLNLIFSSNVTKKRYYVVLVGVFFVIMGGVFVITLATMSEIKRSAPPFTFHQFLGEYKNRYSLSAEQYDDIRPEHARLSGVSIASEMVTGPFMKVFVAYPKYLDNSLKQICQLPDVKNLDSLPKPVRRLLIDSLRSDCFSRSLTVLVNDSTYGRTDWLFHRHIENGTIGVVTYIQTKGFKTGKNFITVQLPSIEKQDSMMVLGEVPFGFSPL